MPCNRLLAAVCALVAANLAPASPAADWLQFRGPSAAAVAPDSVLPTSLSAANVAWKSELPGRGPSSPIVVKDRVIVTCSDGVQQDRLLVLCFSAETGRQLWRRQFWATGRTATHPSSGNAAPTPASDGQFIFAFYSSNDLVCLDLEGNLQWYRGLAFDYPKAGNDIGMASSPLVVGETVVVQIENQGDSFAAGLDKRTGETRWRVDRGRTANWCSPVALPNAKNELIAVLLQSPTGLTAHDPLQGTELWRFDHECATITSTVTAPGRVYVPSQGVTALELKDDSPSPSILWQSNRISPGPASSILHDGKLYAISRAGVLTCADAETGDEHWKLRVKGSYWGTPVLAGGHVYLANQDGELNVVDVRGEKGKVVSTLALGETIQASLAAAGNALYVRSNKYLWKITD